MDYKNDKYVKEIEERLHLFESAYNEIVDVNCQLIKDFSGYMSFVSHMSTRIKWSIKDIVDYCSLEESKDTIQKMEDNNTYTDIILNISPDNMKMTLSSVEIIDKYIQQLKDKTTNVSDTIIDIYQAHQESVDNNNSIDIINKSSGK
jgi:hypothetical protein